MFKRNQHLSIGEAINKSEVSHYKKDQIQEILCQEIESVDKCTYWIKVVGNKW